MKTPTPKTVMVTGAEGALGSVVARKFAASGSQVVATYFTSIPEELKNAPGFTWVQMNLSESTSVRDGIAQAQAKVGEIESLVHCAGGFRYMAIDQVKDEDLDFLLNANLRSSVLLLRELIPSMKKSKFGRVVLISSKATFSAPAGMGVYAATKAGINMLVNSVAEEVREFDININAVAPTMIDTPANRRDMPTADFSKWVSREALAEIIFSLTQSWGQPIHGAVIPVAGRL